MVVVVAIVKTPADTAKAISTPPNTLPENIYIITKTIKIEGKTNIGYWNKKNNQIIKHIPDKTGINTVLKISNKKTLFFFKFIIVSFLFIVFY